MVDIQYSVYMISTGVTRVSYGLNDHPFCFIFDDGQEEKWESQVVPPI